jgi:hypothetical protein
MGPDQNAFSRAQYPRIVRTGLSIWNVRLSQLATYLFGAGAVQSSSAKAQKQLTDIEMWDGFAAQHHIGVVHYNISQILAMFNRTRHLADKANILAWALHEPTLLYFEVRCCTQHRCICSKAAGSNLCFSAAQHHEAESDRSLWL